MTDFARLPPPPRLQDTGISTNGDESCRTTESHECLTHLRLLQNLHGYQRGGVIAPRNDDVPPGECRGFARGSSILQLSLRRSTALALHPDSTSVTACLLKTNWRGLLAAALILRRYRFARRVVLSGCLAAGGSSLLIAQGPLPAPGAPVATTEKLQQIEPRTDIAELSGDARRVKVVTGPGSYHAYPVACQRGCAARVKAASSRLSKRLTGASMCPARPA